MDALRDICELQTQKLVVKIPSIIDRLSDVTEEKQVLLDKTEVDSNMHLKMTD